MGEMWTKRVEYGATMGAPVWENHKRGKNWMATIQIDPTAPGGLRRSFVDKARGAEYFYLVSPDLLGKPVEIGADYYSGGGNKTAVRKYGVIRILTDEKIGIELFETARGAINASKRPAPTKHTEAQKRAIIAAYGKRHAAAMAAKPKPKPKPASEPKPRTRKAPAKRRPTKRRGAASKPRKPTTATRMRTMQLQRAARRTGKPQAVYTSTRQTGTTTKRDKLVKAMPPGKRVSASGRVYYEYRKNRTDVRGKRI